MAPGSPPIQTAQIQVPEWSGVPLHLPELAEFPKFVESIKVSGEFELPKYK